MPKKDYYSRNRDKCIADALQWKRDNPERSRKSDRESARRVRATEDGLARSKAAQKKHYDKNPKKRLAATRKWRAKNPGYHSRWHAANKKKNPVLYMWRNCRNRAKALGIEFSIEQRDIIVPEFCPVLGIKLHFNHGKKGFYASESPSVDRFDNTKGYIKGNIRVISWRANMLKRDATIDEIRRLLDYMQSG